MYVWRKRFLAFSKSQPIDFQVLIMSVVEEEKLGEDDNEFWRIQGHCIKNPPSKPDYQEMPPGHPDYHVYKKQSKQSKLKLPPKKKKTIAAKPQTKKVDNLTHV